MSTKHKLTQGWGYGYLGTMSRNGFLAATSNVKSGECFQDDHDECSGRFDLGDEVEGWCNCCCHFEPHDFYCRNVACDLRTEQNALARLAADAPATTEAP